MPKSKAKSKSKKKSASTQHQNVRVDISLSALAKQIAGFDPSTAARAIDALDAFKKKVDQMTWADVQKQSSGGSKKTGINYEVLDEKTHEKTPIASVRISGAWRARVTRYQVYMVVLSLHPDHDSAYKKLKQSIAEFVKSLIERVN